MPCANNQPGYMRLSTFTHKAELKVFMVWYNHAFTQVLQNIAYKSFPEHEDHRYIN